MVKVARSSYWYQGIPHRFLQSISCFPRFPGRFGRSLSRLWLCFGCGLERNCLSLNSDPVFSWAKTWTDSPQALLLKLVPTGPFLFCQTSLSNTTQLQCSLSWIQYCNCTQALRRVLSSEFPKSNKRSAFFDPSRKLYVLFEFAGWWLPFWLVCCFLCQRFAPGFDPFPVLKWCFQALVPWMRRSKTHLFPGSLSRLCPLKSRRFEMDFRTFKSLEPLQSIPDSKMLHFLSRLSQGILYRLWIFDFEWIGHHHCLLLNRKPDYLYSKTCAAQSHFGS